MKPRARTSKFNFTPAVESFFDDNPDVKGFLIALTDGVCAFERRLQNARDASHSKRVAHAANCLMQFDRDVRQARGAFGFGEFEERDFRREILAKVRNIPARQLSLGEIRANRVSVAYSRKLRPDFVGAKDTPMEVALQVAALCEGLSLDQGPETVRKSIQRFRKSLAGAELVRFDEKSSKFKIVGAEKLLPGGLPTRPGRPKKCQSSS